MLVLQANKGKKSVAYTESNFAQALEIRVIPCNTIGTNLSLYNGKSIIYIKEVSL